MVVVYYLPINNLYTKYIAVWGDMKSIVFFYKITHGHRKVTKATRRKTSRGHWSNVLLWVGRGEADHQSLRLECGCVEMLSLLNIHFFFHDCLVPGNGWHVSKVILCVVESTVHPTSEEEKCYHLITWYNLTMRKATLANLKYLHNQYGHSCNSARPFFTSTLERPSILQTFSRVSCKHVGCHKICKTNKNQLKLSGK